MKDFFFFFLPVKFFKFSLYKRICSNLGAAKLGESFLGVAKVDHKARSFSYYSDILFVTKTCHANNRIYLVMS